MNSVSADFLVKQLNWRYAVKRFDPTRKIPADQWDALEQALVLTPSSFGLQPWRFVVVTDQAIKDKLVPISWGQKQPAQASHMVVFAIRINMGEADVDRFLRRTAEVRGTTVESMATYRKMMLGTLTTPPPKFDVNNWATLQTYIAIGNFMTAAAMLGIDTCPMEGIDPAKYDEVLGLTAQGYATVVGCAAGYRAAEDKYAAQPKVRFAVDDVIMRI